MHRLKVVNRQTDIRPTVEDLDTVSLYEYCEKITIGGE